jgi:hypothetical protein
MKKINNIFTFFLTLLVFAGCKDYNEKNFPGYDSATLTDVVQYEAVLGSAYYPEDPIYFTDRTAMTDAINKMLKDTFLYVDKTSTAKIHVLYGDITSGFSTANATYTLATADYDAMGSENGQPGRFDNFDGNMDVDGYLIEFIGQKYSSLEQGTIINITYMFYATGAGATAQTRSYEKRVDGWHKIELNAFTADLSYAMVKEDYDAMGTESGTPGRYDNFDANMDTDHYISAMLGQKYPYAKENMTAQVSYLFFASGATSTRTNYYKHDGTRWNAYNPYAEIIDVTTKIAEVTFDGTDWILDRLVGGAMKYTLAKPADYQKLIDWVKVNKPAYVSTINPNEEFYFGAAISATYTNINNNYNTWKNYYNIGGQYDGLSDEALQKIMDERIAEGIATVILREIITDPDPGLSYQVTYEVYSGSRAGNNMQAFMYDESTGAYKVVSAAPVKQ